MTLSLITFDYISGNFSVPALIVHLYHEDFFYELCCIAQPPQSIMIFAEWFHVALATDMTFWWWLSWIPGTIASPTFATFKRWTLQSFQFRILLQFQTFLTLLAFKIFYNCASLHFLDTIYSILHSNILFYILISAMETN